MKGTLVEVKVDLGDDEVPIGTFPVNELQSLMLAMQAYPLEDGAGNWHQPVRAHWTISPFSSQCRLVIDTLPIEAPELEPAPEGR